MATITVQAVYHKGALRLKKKLDLPEDALVQVDVTPLDAAPVASDSLFGAFSEKAITEQQPLKQYKAPRKHSAFGLWAKYPEAQDPVSFAQTLREQVEKRQDA